MTVDDQDQKRRERISKRQSMIIITGGGVPGWCSR